MKLTDTQHKRWTDLIKVCLYAARVGITISTEVEFVEALPKAEALFKSDIQLNNIAGNLHNQLLNSIS